jgi:hypothetical protein
MLKPFGPPDKDSCYPSGLETVGGTVSGLRLTQFLRVRQESNALVADQSLCARLDTGTKFDSFVAGRALSRPGAKFLSRVKPWPTSHPEVRTRLDGWVYVRIGAGAAGSCFRADPAGGRSRVSYVADSAGSIATVVDASWAFSPG